MKILLVEDEQNLASTLKEGLEKEGHFVDVAGNSIDGMNKAEQHPADVIIMDVILPVIDGLTALSTLREKGINTPVILLTAEDAVMDQARMADAGAGDSQATQRVFGQLVSKVRSLLRMNISFRTK